MEELSPLQLAVKSDYKRLVADFDGPANAARFLDAQASHISEAASPNWPRHPRADHIRAMEQYLGKPVYTRAAAAALGYELVPRDEVKSPVTAVTAAVDLVKRIAALQVLKAEAEADGDLDAQERRMMIDALQKLISGAHDLIIALKDHAQ